MTLCSQVEYARRHGVSQPAVSLWKQRGWLVLGQGDLIDAEQSDARLAQYRDPNDGRSKRGRRAAIERTAPPPPVASQASHPLLAGLFGNPPPPPVPELPSEADIAALESGSATTEEARRIKENYLALQAKQRYDQENGSTVELAVARSVLFESAQAQRNAWLGWPTNAGPLIAADLGIEVDKLVPVLARYVHQHLTELGEPDGQFGNR